MDSLQDLAIKRQILIERFTNSKSKDFDTLYRRLNNILKQAILLNDDELSDLNLRRLNAFTKNLKKDLEKVFSDTIKEYQIDLIQLADIQQQQELDLFSDELKRKSTGGRKRIRKPEEPEKSLVKPLRADGGGNVLDIIQENKDFTIRELEREIKLQATEGKTNEQITRELVGSKKDKIDKSKLKELRRKTKATVRTANNATATQARHQIYDENDDVVVGYIWVATLDFKTTTICRHLDGKEYKTGKGPLPPAHYNCRSTTIPKLADEFSFLVEGSSRSSLNGPVKNQNFYDWLKGRDTEEQDEVLGEKRGKLFRDGGLSIEEFSNLTLSETLKPLTLEEMKELNPRAFKKANI